ncbi:hypothetical protein B6A42_01480 [Vibrio coralliilyticus]|nr:hypothetical protein B6A42_01480 [Vibrio coralliilyticus]
MKKIIAIINNMSSIVHGRVASILTNELSSFGVEVTLAANKCKKHDFHKLNDSVDMTVLDKKLNLIEHLLEHFKVNKKYTTFIFKRKAKLPNCSLYDLVSFLSFLAMVFIAS